jgi:uncharacterized membrane protein
MSLAPLLAASPAVQLHTVAALAAVLAGAAQMLRPKGTPSHRRLGWVFVALMLTAALTSFAIHEIRLWGPWSPIHILSVIILVTVTRSVWLARHGRIEAHRQSMRGAFFGGLLIAGVFTLVPGRIMHAVVFGGAPDSGETAGGGLLWAWILGAVVLVGAAPFVWRRLRPQRPAG